ncbi:hypothetical protein VTN31DRAFT_157 [Thermomyces dupontii]|uniref:uncharacterized protein n=1 Tax=Talaromyces thermophilus TaxID=28565 RepID=UPI0037436E5E
MSMAAANSIPTPRQTSQQGRSQYTPWRPTFSSGLSTGNGRLSANGNQADEDSRAIDPSILPTGSKSLSGISIRAFLIGIVLGISAIVALLSAVLHHPIWRLPCFLTSLCLFHFLEFYITARYNTRHADVSAFLLSSNGAAYNIAHGSAMVECLVTHWLFPSINIVAKSKTVSNFTLLMGLALMGIGQTVRTLAMAHAGTNFNHTIQVERKEGHRLVTDGIYRFLRHPSYFGFFWWGLGTQLMMQNVICFIGYTVVLWQFFSQRIHREEHYLIAFFGNQYVEYRKKTRVGIPFIP